MSKASLVAIGFITAFAQILAAAPADRLVDQPAKSIRGLRISGYKGSLKFIGLDADESVKGAKAAPTNLTVDAVLKTDDQTWRPILENVDGWIQISIQGPQSKTDWRNIQMPPVDIEVRGPSVPIVLAWKEGDLVIKNWKATANLTHHEGKVVSEGGTAALKLTSLEGEVTVNGHNGRFTLDNYNARVTLKKIEGGMVLENFSGNLVVDDSKGEI
ncbi:MAG: hypothetical protein ABL958_18550, partial [Bdellovibrionia bacterium]